MNRSILKQLLKKDLYMTRHFILGSVLGSIISLVIATMGRNSFYLGGLLFLTNMIALGIFVGMYCVAKERENRSWLFVLSLPISYAQYSLAKMTSSLAIYLISWGLSLLAGVVIIIFDDSLPLGLIPALIVLMGFLLQNFVLFLSVVLSVKSEAWLIAAIIVTNTSVTIFIQFLFGLSSVANNMEGEAVVWSSELMLTLLVQFVLMLLVLGVALTFQLNKKDVL